MHLVLHIDHAMFEEDGIDYERNLYKTLNSITISIGWHRDADDIHLFGDPGRFDPVYANSVCRHLIDRIFDELSPLENIDVVISPFLESGDHRYCFPQNIPMGTRSSGHGKTGPYVNVEFRSACDCGRESADICKAQFRSAESPHICTITDTPVNNNRLEGDGSRCSHMGGKVLPVNRLVVVA
jgi:hypothetical protein